jgi:hypothetical protein
MRRERIDNRWQPWRWALADVVPHEDGFGAAPRLLLKDEREERWLHPGFKVELFTDDAEGLLPQRQHRAPCFWVVWRMEEEALLADEPVARAADRHAELPRCRPLAGRAGNRGAGARAAAGRAVAAAFVDQHYVPGAQAPAATAKLQAADGPLRQPGQREHRQKNRRRRPWLRKPDFLGRWARRKEEARKGKTALEEPAAAVAAHPGRTRSAAAGRQAASPAPDPAATPDAAPAKVLTLEDTRLLTQDSDFKPFMAGDVSPEVRNAAMKKLFADPHFNVMDGLDTYIDDYSKSDPIPESMLRQMASAKFLKLFDDEDETKIKTKTRRARRTPPPVRESANNPTAKPWHSPMKTRHSPAERRRQPANPAPTRPVASQEDHATLICDCNQTMPLQPQALGAALNENLTLHSALCRREAGAFQKAVQSRRRRGGGLHPGKAAVCRGRRSRPRAPPRP